MSYIDTDIDIAGELVKYTPDRLCDVTTLVNQVCRDIEPGTHATVHSMSYCNGDWSILVKRCPQGSGDYDFAARVQARFFDCIDPDGDSEVRHSVRILPC